MAVADDFDLDRWTIDGGGEMRSVGGGYELSGTIGQPDAGDGRWRLRADRLLGGPCDKLNSTIRSRLARGVCTGPTVGRAAG